MDLSHIMEISNFEALILSFSAIVMGLLMLIKGGNWTIDSAVYVARHFGIPPLIVGFTIVAFGTSLPELVVSILANFQGSAGIAMGNVIGSNIANILIVLGIVGFMTTIHANTSKAMIKDLSFMLLATIVLLVLMQTGVIGQVAGALMIVVLLVYVFLQYQMASKGQRPMEDDDDLIEFTHHLEPYLFLFLGLVAVALGAEFLVRGAKISATVVGVPEDVIALSIIAFGTSLPELSTSIIAMRKNQSDIVLGNIIGSNVFNILLILGFTAVIKPITAEFMAPQLIDFDIWVALIVSIIFAAVLLLYRKIDKPVAGLFILAYFAYNIYIYTLHIGGIGAH